jgi:hypothetical protein
MIHGGAVALRVTFDTSVLDHVIKPEQQSAGAGEIVRAALGEGRIKGFISEAVVALDVFGRDKKVEMVGRGQMLSQSRATGPQKIEISIGPQWTRPELHPKSAERIQGAFAIGIKMLIGPRRFLDLLPGPEFRDHYEEYPSPDEFLVCSAKTNEVDRELGCRGLGRARAIALGLKLSKQAGANGEWWVVGLGRAISKLDDAGRKFARKKVHEAINEWADGDAIAAHVGHGNDLFCTHDLAGNSGYQSVLHPHNRAWLQKQYGVQFVTLSELAARVPGC